MTKLHSALRAQTVKEFDARHPHKPRPPVEVVCCEECARLKAENEALRDEIKLLQSQLALIASEGMG